MRRGFDSGVLERALELEQRVGPLPSPTTPTLVEGVRMMFADEHEPARDALQRAHAAALARGSESGTRPCLALSDRTRVPRWRLGRAR